MKFVRQFKNISWGELESWVGSRIFQRGESYFKRGRVKNLALCSEGLIADVTGGDDYITLVSFAESSEDSGLNSRCTCPYGISCKHAVAVILTYVDAVKKGKKTPEIGSSDLRLKRIKEGPRRDDLEDDFEEETDDEEMPLKSDPNKDIALFLEKHSKDSLIELVTQLSAKHPNTCKDLLDRSRLSSGKTKEIASSIRKEITSIMSEPAWHSHWSDEGNLADFSRVEKNLKNLFNQGKYETVVDLTKFLLERAYPYIETCNDDGDSAGQISECLDIGFKALRKCTWSNFDKLLFAMNSQLEDDYELCRGASEIIDTIDDKETWSKLANHFYKQLKNLPTSEKKDGFSRNYHRDRVSNDLVRALENSERSDEVLSIYEAEAKITGSWERLVHFLMKQKQYEKARLSAVEGIKAIGNKWPGITNSLRETIATLAAKQGDYNGILLLKQEDFLNHPDLSSFDALLKAAIKTKNGEEIRAWALIFLETGKAPPKGALKKVHYPENRFHREFPQYEILINIAEKEKRVDDVWKLYQAAIHKKSYFHSHVQVARIVKDKYPGESLKIWQSLAENNIAQTNPSAYSTAVGYLKEVQDIFLKMKRPEEWATYIDQLRETNKRKPRFIKELRSLSGEKLL